MRNQKRLLGPLRGLIAATGCGLLVGCLVGMGAMGSYTHALWPALAGLVVGMTSSLASPSRKVLIAFGGGSVAVIAAVVTIVLVQIRRGHWPITEEFTLVHYGSATQATVQTVLILGVLIGLPCLITAALVALTGRRTSA